MNNYANNQDYSSGKMVFVDIISSSLNDRLSYLPNFLKIILFLVVKFFHLNISTEF